MKKSFFRKQETLEKREKIQKSPALHCSAGRFSADLLFN